MLCGGREREGERESSSRLPNMYPVTRRTCEGEARAEGRRPTGAVIARRLTLRFVQTVYQILLWRRGSDPHAYLVLRASHADDRIV